MLNEILERYMVGAYALLREVSACIYIYIYILMIAYINGQLRGNKREKPCMPGRL